MKWQSESRSSASFCPSSVSSSFSSVTSDGDRAASCRTLRCGLLPLLAPPRSPTTRMTPTTGDRRVAGGSVVDEDEVRRLQLPTFVVLLLNSFRWCLSLCPSLAGKKMFLIMFILFWALSIPMSLENGAWRCSSTADRKILASRPRPVLMSFSSMFFGASAKLLNSCADVIPFQSGDSVQLHDCPDPIRMFVVSGAPCENITLSLRRVTLSEGIDWSMCQTQLQNITITVDESTILRNAVFRVERSSFGIVLVNDITIVIRRSVANLTTTNENDRTTLIHVLMPFSTTSLIANVNLVLVDCHIFSTTISRYSRGVIAVDNFNDVRNISLDWVNSTVDLEDVLLTTRFEALLIQGGYMSTLHTRIANSSFRLMLPNCNEGTLNLWSFYNRTVSPVSFPGVEVTVLAVQVIMNTTTQFLAYGVGTFTRVLHIEMPLIDAILTVDGLRGNTFSAAPFRRLIQFPAVLHCTITVTNCVADFDGASIVGSANMVLVGIARLWEHSTLTVRNVSASAMVYDGAGSVDPSLAVVSLMNVGSDDVRSSSVTFTDSVSVLTIATGPPSRTFVLTSASLGITLGTGWDCHLVVERVHVVLRFGSSHQNTENAGGSVVAMSQDCLRSSIVVRNCSLTATLYTPRQFGPKPQYLSRASLITSLPSTETFGIRFSAEDNFFRLESSTITASQYIANAIAAVLFGSVQMRNNSIQIVDVEIVEIPLPYAPAPAPLLRGLLGATGIECLTTGPLTGDHTMMVFHVEAWSSAVHNQSAVLSVDESSFSSTTSGSTTVCAVHVILHDIVTLGSSPTATTTTASSSAVKWLSPAPVSQQWHLDDCTFRQPLLFGAPQSAWGPQSRIVLQGCNRMGVSRKGVSLRTLGAPRWAVDTANATCGLSESSSSSLTVTEQPYPAGAGIEARTSLLLSHTAGAAALASGLTQWACGVALQRSTGVFSIAGCGGEDALDLPLDIGTSPLQIGFGASHGQYTRGAVLGNMMLCVGLFLCGWMFGAFELWSHISTSSSTDSSVGKKKKKQQQQHSSLTCEALRHLAASTSMPTALVVPVWGVLLPPTATASVSLLWTGEPGDLELALAGLLLSLGTAMWLCWRLCVSFHATAFRLAPRRRRLSHVSRVAAIVKRLVGRSWGWRDARAAKGQSQSSSSDHKGFAVIYGPIFDTSRGGAHWWPAIEFTVAVLSAAVCGLLLSEDRACDAVVASVGSASALLALLMLWYKPHDTLLDMTQSVVANGMAAVAAGVALGKESADSIAFVLWTQTALALLSLFLNLCCFWVEFFRPEGLTHRAHRTGFLARVFAQCFLRFELNCRGASSSSGSESDGTADSSDDDDHRRNKKKRRFLTAPGDDAVAERAKQQQQQQRDEKLEKLIRTICENQRKQRHRLREGGVGGGAISA